MSLTDTTTTRRRMIAVAMCLTAVARDAALAKVTSRARVGLWLRMGAPDELAETLALLAQRNEVFTRLGRLAPWLGLIFERTWGQIEHDSGPLRLGDVRTVLDATSAAGLAVVLQVSDKEWQYKPTDTGYGAPVPLDLDVGPIARADFERCIGGLCQDRYRYASMQDDTKKGRPGAAVRKYVAKRWVVQDRWLAMWAKLGHAVGQHPALHAVVTPESAMALPNQADLERVGYPGADWFVDFLVAQARTMRKAFPAGVQVVSNTNVVPPDNARNLPRVVRQLAKDGHSIWAQDLNRNGNAYKALYPLLNLFPTERRWAMVTNTSDLTPEGMIKLAQSLGIGHLAFLHRKFEAQVRVVESLQRGDAAFLPD